jgi:hypothetical protein
MLTNLVDAALVATKLAIAPETGLTSCLPMLVLKSDWVNVQIVGTYDLIYPWLHIDFPTRLEVQAELQVTMNDHTQNMWHNGIASSPMYPAYPVAPATLFPNELVVGLEGLRVRSMSVANAVGYGVGSENIIEDFSLDGGLI